MAAILGAVMAGLSMVQGQHNFNKQMEAERDNRQLTEEQYEQVRESFESYGRTVLEGGDFADVITQYTGSGLLGEQTARNLNVISDALRINQDITADELGSLSAGIGGNFDASTRLANEAAANLRQRIDRGADIQRSIAQGVTQQARGAVNQASSRTQDNIVANRDRVGALAKRTADRQAARVNESTQAQLSELDAIEAQNQVTAQLGQDAGRLTGDLLGANGPEAQQAARDQMASSPALQSRIKRVTDQIQNSAFGSGNVGGRVISQLADNVTRLEQENEATTVSQLQGQQGIGQQAQSRIDQSQLQQANVLANQGQQLSSIEGNRGAVDIQAQRDLTQQRLQDIDRNLQVALRSGDLEAARTLEAEKTRTQQQLGRVNQQSDRQQSAIDDFGARQFDLGKTSLTANLAANNAATNQRLATLGNEAQARLGDMQDMASAGVKLNPDGGVGSNIGETARSEGVQFGLGAENFAQNLTPATGITGAGGVGVGVGELLEAGSGGIAAGQGAIGSSQKIVTGVGGALNGVGGSLNTMAKNTAGNLQSMIDSNQFATNDSQLPPNMRGLSMQERVALTRKLNGQQPIPSVGYNPQTGQTIAPPIQPPINFEI